MVHGSFREIMEAVVLPRKVVHPDHARLDGWITGGHWGVTGSFEYQGRIWNLYEDSHYEPLLLAYAALQQNDEDPFVIGNIKSGLRLDLRPDLQAQRSTRYRHLYIYSSE
jgi:hypothetical protein